MFLIFGVSKFVNHATELAYRLATYWLPVAPGWLAWRVLQWREYV